MQAGLRGVRPIVLASSIAASVALHAAILIATLPGGEAGMGTRTPPEIRASLVALPAPPQLATEQPAPVAPVLAALPDRSPVTVPTPERAPPAMPRMAPAGSRPGLGNVDVPAEPLADRSRLGGYYTRQMNEFPVEIDRPVRFDHKIVARYPQSALAQGREDAVAVWVIIDASGSVEDVRVVEGSEEFANEVVAAVRAARFLPAEDNLKPIRYPIALQFDFRVGTVATAR